MECLLKPGHTKTSTTQVYARVLEEKVSNDIASLKVKPKQSKEGVNLRTQLNQVLIQVLTMNKN